MKTISIVLLFIGYIFLFKTDSNANEQKIYLSPDGRYTAYVIPLPGAKYGSGESEIDIRSANGKVLFFNNYGSEDGEHGFGVERASWTPDSKYFVFSMSSSGGHQSWHFPTYFVTTDGFKLYNLDELLGIITEPDFKLFSPNVIEVVGRSITNSEKEIKFRARLNDLIKSK